MSVQIHEERRPTRAARLTFDPPVVCPAGTPVYETARGSGCRCAIEQNTLTAHDDPSSLLNFCFGAYIFCPTWREEKLRIEEGTVQPLAEREDKMPSREEVLGVEIERPEEVEVTYFEEP
jgi:hypothetical protein